MLLIYNNYKDWNFFNYLGRLNESIEPARVYYGESSVKRKHVYNTFLLGVPDVLNKSFVIGYSSSNVMPYIEYVA